MKYDCALGSAEYPVGLYGGRAAWQGSNKRYSSALTAQIACWSKVHGLIPNIPLGCATISGYTCKLQGRESSARGLCLAKEHNAVVMVKAFFRITESELVSVKKATLPEPLHGGTLFPVLISSFQRPPWVELITDYFKVLAILREFAVKVRPMDWRTRSEQKCWPLMQRVGRYEEVEQAVLGQLFTSSAYSVGLFRYIYHS